MVIFLFVPINAVQMPFLIEICCINKKPWRVPCKDWNVFFLRLASSVNQVLSGILWQITCL